MVFNASESMQYLAWPAAFLVFGIIALLLFRRNIAGRIDKIQKVERTGISMEAEQAQVAPMETKVSQFQELMDSTNSPLLRRQETTICDALKSKGITNEQETIKILTRALAGSLLALRWEQIERMIFGSQLNALVAINANSLGLPVQQIKGFYDTAVRQFPAVYRNYRFEQWLQFLEGQQLISLGANGYQVTIDGKEFMAWMVHAGRTHQHPN